MNRFSRINTIWRKELIDTLRDRRTLVAMVLVPLVLYPALMLGSLQAVDVQLSGLGAERYSVGVADEAARLWLRTLLDSDAARRNPASEATAEELVKQADGAVASRPAAEAIEPGRRIGGMDLRETPPAFDVLVCADVRQAVLAGDVQVGVVLAGSPPSRPTTESLAVQLIFDKTDIRSDFGATGLQGVLERAAASELLQRLRRLSLSAEFVQPLAVTSENVATAERMAGFTLGQIIPLILILMTITGAIYPAIDLTAGERERGTLETLMAAPVPTVDLVTGKFIVVALIGLLSALLNLLSMAGTIYLGVGSFLFQDGQVQIPLRAILWVFVLLIPLAVLFAAMLLAVCSFARSFKEAQNYIVPVMMAALIPGVVGILPGTRLEGPIVIMPVANLVVLTRELFLGKFPFDAVLWVLLSTSLYAAAAVAVAARLFGQEAVLFADSGSVKTLFQRRFFRPANTPSAATALLMLTLLYSLNFYVQQSLGRAGLAGLGFLLAVAGTLALLLGLIPWLTANYLRIRAETTFLLNGAAPLAWGAALCLGASTWMLMRRWLEIQERFLPLDPRIQQAIESQLGAVMQANPWLLVLLIAIIPAVVEELFFRGFVLSGLRASLPSTVAILISALAFGLFHYMAQRLVPTMLLGVLLGYLVVQFGSIWPAILVHALHNGISVLAAHPAALQPWFESFGIRESEPSPDFAVWSAVVLTAIGVLICRIRGRRPRGAADPSGQPLVSSS